MNYKDINLRLRETECEKILNLIHMGWELESTLLDSEGEKIMTKELETIVFYKSFNSDESHKVLETIKELDSMYCYDDNYFSHKVSYTPVR